MTDKTVAEGTGEQLIKQDLITREELDQARESEARSGVPWYKQLIQQRKLTFQGLENVLRYEFHSRASRTAHESLGNALVRRGSLRPEQLEMALADQKRNGRLLGNVLLEKGFVTRADIALALAEQHGMEFADLEKSPSEAEALEAVPESLALKNGMLPITLEADRLTVLVASPQSHDRARDAGVLLGKRIHILLTACEDLEEEIRARYRDLAEGDVAVITEPAPDEAPSVTPAKTAKPVESAAMTNPYKHESIKGESDQSRFSEVAKLAAGAPIVKMVSTIVEGAVNAGATDIHLDPQDPETRVRYRIDGILHDIMSIPHSQHAAVASRVKILADMDITETRHPQDGHFSVQISGHDLDIRVATMPTFVGERLVMRLLDQASVLSGIKDLGLEKDDETSLGRLIHQPYGMILVTGPTGSGKTTSLYAALNQKNVMTESIVTLEDPVEYQLSGINQVQVETDIGLTFASTLRAAMRQDIDVLLVGEIRDQDTAHIAIRAAMTGHLVFSTLHTNDAPEAISTLRNMGVAPFLISSALTAVVGQRLVRKICTNCKKSFKPKPDLLASMGLPEDIKRLYRGTGCNACHFTGCSGRTGIFELLEVTPEVRNMILAEVPPHEIAQTVGMKSMGDRCREKIKAGIVSPEEYLRVIRV